MESEPIRVVEFDFNTRVDRQISFGEVADARATGLCCWVNIDLRRYGDTENYLRELGINPVVISGVLSGDPIGRYTCYDDCIHVLVTEPNGSSQRLEFSSVDVILADRLVITLHRADVRFLSRAQQNYRNFFQCFAQSMGFMVFECFDGLIDAYQTAFLNLQEEVETLRDTIFEDLDDSIFSRVSEVTHDLLRLRRNLIADRETLQQLAIHKSAFVSESTQPYLVTMAGTMERLSGDVAIAREVLAETLTLFLGIVTHRTNRILSRLTVISVIFLPLTFLVGLYGMNFESQPEFGWQHGYAFFWAVAAMIFLSSIALIRVKRWF